MSLADCVEKLGLKKRHWLSPVDNTPRLFSCQNVSELSDGPCSAPYRTP
jgi:hypothetical protein